MKKENGPRASSAPALGLNTIIFKHVYWYMQQTQVSVYRTIGPLVCDFSLIHEVFINIRSQFDNYILLHGYIALQKQSFDNYFCFLGLSVAKIHVVI